jgi:tRNA (cmo5U34)-methyltransferase
VAQWPSQSGCTSSEKATAYLERAKSTFYRTKGKRVLLELIPPDAASILDLGTGDGRLLALLKIEHPSSVGVALDFSPAMLEATRRRRSWIQDTPRGDRMEDKRKSDAAPNFDSERAQKYDQRIRTAVPGYEALHSMARSLLWLDLEEQARLLIVGVGTGMELVHLGKNNLRWRFTGVDPSADMLAVARQRVTEGNISERVTLHAGLAHDLPALEPYDAATLILVMHFVPDNGEKLELLQSISTRLKPNGPFILVDLHGDRTSDRFARFIAAWRLRQIALGMSTEEVEEMFQRILTETHFVPEQRITALLHEAGFNRVEPFYGALLYGGWVARRSTSGG